MLFCQTGKKLIILIREHLKEKMHDCLPAFVQVCGSPAFIPPSLFHVGGTKRRISKLTTQRMKEKNGWKSYFQRCKKERSYKNRGGREVPEGGTEGMVGSTRGNNGSTEKTEGWGGAEEAEGGGGAEGGSAQDANRIRRKQHSMGRGGGGGGRKRHSGASHHISVWIHYFFFWASPQKMSKNICGETQQTGHPACQHVSLVSHAWVRCTFIQPSSQ